MQSEMTNPPQCKPVTNSISENKDNNDYTACTELSTKQTIQVHVSKAMEIAPRNG